MVVMHSLPNIQMEEAGRKRVVAPENTYTLICQSRRGQRDSDKHHWETKNIEWHSMSLATIQNVFRGGKVLGVS